MNVLDFDYVRSFVREDSAIILEPGKEYLVESRLLSLIHREKFDSIESLTSKLRSGTEKNLQKKVVEAMTTNETSFFRDLHPFEALKKNIFPDIIARRTKDKKINIWCGAASTGQEPYSLLILISEHFPHLLTWDFKFIATDLSEEVLAKARAGRFSQLDVNRGLPSPFLLKYFKRVGTEWEVCADLRKHVTFQPMNLAKPWPLLPQFDLVMLRNVMIYFNLEMKKSILTKMRSQMTPEAYLMLGSAETTLNVSEEFDRSVFEKTTCYRIKK